MDHNESFEDVLKRFEEMLHTNKSYFFDLEEFLDIIDEYISFANYNLASKAIDLALEQYENNVDVLLYKAELFSLIDNLEKAEEIIAYIKILEPNRQEVPLLEAELYSRKDMHVKAIKSLKKALKNTDDKSEVYELLTVEYLYLEDYKSALNYSLSALKEDINNSTALYNAVTCYNLLDQSIEAITFLKKHVKKVPFSDVGWSLLGKKYIDIEDYNKALSALEFAIAIDDKFLGAYYDIAFVYSKLNNLKKALEYYKLTLDIADPTAFTYYHIGKIYQKLNDKISALEYYLLSIDQDPGYYKSWMMMINIKIDQKKYDDALHLTNKALEVINNQDLFELLGNIQVLRNNFSEAIVAFEMSIKLGKPKLLSILKLADLYKLNNRIEEYRNILLEAKKQFPDSKEITKRMMNKE